MTITSRATRILVLFTIISLEEGDGSYDAAVARDALRCARPVASGVEKARAKEEYFPLPTGERAEDHLLKINDREFP
jgi:hypothetical protein